MSIVGAPPATAAAKHRKALEEARRLNALQVDNLAHAVTSLDDEAGWARLTELGTRSTVAAQQTAVTATTDLLSATLDAVGLVGDIADLPGITPGRLSSGKDVRGMFAMTRDVVANRVAGGASFAEGLDSSANVLTAIASSEPHRIARDGQFNTGLADERFDRYRRVAVGTSCKFCAMLATRGAVFLTATSAGKGRQYHYKCDCYVELVVDAAQVKASTGAAPFSSVSKDWRNAVKSPDRLNAAQVRKEWAQLTDEQVANLATPAQHASREALDEQARRLAKAIDTPPPVTVLDDVAEAIPTAPRFDADSVQKITNADLDNELTAAYNASDDAAADLLESEMNRRQKWADGWGRSYDEYDEWRPLDVDPEDLPDFDDIPQPVVSRRAARAEWDAEQEIRTLDAESYGGGVLPELATEARSKGITLHTLMTGDPRTAYKYANQELLKWWADPINGGRRPFYEIEAVHGRYDSTKLAKARMTEGRARERAERLLGKSRAEGVARLDRERRAAKAARR